MSSNHEKQLVNMTNQIAANLGGGRDEEAAAAATCRHLETFWARSMKQRLVAISKHDDNDLSLLAKRAVDLLEERLAERQAG
ncbi:MULTISPECIES: formate dehydrogenase subunit delta [Halomonadaceae]|uniref:formate dehydrogenase subunit delta n=1 Tax=Halomonadaceae TaxID=28256 RepID=UPI001C634F71|nr:MULTISPECIES: formate dehydrogenase subunit delta [Halomonas]MCG7590693.1 formate dehydrogenase subunit delta [Halomonas sp. McD50-5]MCG7616805.1 formate dehydrogenase subunit delta [Halomonas sp. McD50-4]